LDHLNDNHNQKFLILVIVLCLELESYHQIQQVYLHHLLDAETLDGKFDVTEVKNLKYPDRLNYLRDKNNLPDEIVYQARDKIFDFMTAEDTKLVPGFLGDNKIEGTIFINPRLNKVGFRDHGSNKFRTAVAMKDKKIINLAKTDFHLYSSQQ
jgi:hypothetical protein